MWIQVFHYDDSGWFRLCDAQFEYIKETKELIPWQNIYQCARTKTVLYQSTIEALWKYFHNKAFEDNYEGENNIMYTRLGILYNSGEHAYTSISKKKREVLR